MSKASARLWGVGCGRTGRPGARADRAKHSLSPARRAESERAGGERAKNARRSPNKLAWPMTMGPAPRIMMDLMSVRFLMAAPVFQASNRGGEAAVVAGAAAGGGGPRAGGDGDRGAPAAAAAVRTARRARPGPVAGHAGRVLARAGRDRADSMWGRCVGLWGGCGVCARAHGSLSC